MCDFGAAADVKVNQELIQFDEWLLSYSLVAGVWRLCDGIKDFTDG